jgi:hypothetical protein
MKTGIKKKPKTAKTIASVNRPERVRQKAAGAAANESSVAAELKNREHGQEQPAR